MERANKSIEGSLRAYTDVAQDDWHVFLQAVVFSLNNTVSSVLGYPPSMLVFGKQSTLPLDTSFNIVAKSEITNIRQIMATLAKHRARIIQSASNNLVKAHAKMKARHDEKAKQHDFEVGDYVYLYIPTLIVPHTSKKLQSQYSGPFLILKFHTQFTCYVMRCQDGKIARKPVHVQRLRKPRVKDNKFLLRLQRGPVHSLPHPDKIIEQTLTRVDRALLEPQMKATRNHSKMNRGQKTSLGKAKGKSGKALTPVEIFNLKHGEKSFREEMSIT